jgi:glycosyltransferase involved in cell wall biosynthesis
MRIDFCLPIYNEEKILKNSAGELLNYLRSQNFSFAWKIILIINGSHDNSRPIGDALSLKHPRFIEVIEYAQPGRGQALKKYFAHSPADILVYMDADLAVALTDINPLIEPIINGRADLTFGSRLLQAAKTERSFIRELISRSYILISRLILRHKFSDFQCGFKAVRKSTFLKIWPYLTGDFWFFDTELIIFANYLGYQVKEIPVDWQENRFGGRPTTVKLIHDSWVFFKNLWELRRRLKKLKPAA